MNKLILMSATMMLAATNAMAANEGAPAASGATVITQEACTASSPTTQNAEVIGRSPYTLKTDLMTPETLWAMGRLGGFSLSPNAELMAYGVTYYSVPQNKSHRMIYMRNQKNGETKQLTQSSASEGDAVFIKNGTKVAFLSNEGGHSQLWEMNADGTDRRQLSHVEGDVEGFLFSPNEKHVILVMAVPTHASIRPKYDDLPKASGMVITDLNYRHWNDYVTQVPHPFLAQFDGQNIGSMTDLLEGTAFECPMLPFGGMEQLCWSPDSRSIAYTCRKKTGRDYAVSTDSDIYLYSLDSKTTVNLCKPQGYQAPEVDYTRSLQHQAVNQQKEDCNVGYDINPQFSPDGKYIAWQSMERDGYESDRNRLCVRNLATGEKTYVTEALDTNVEGFTWGKDSKTLYFNATWHATTQLYTTNLKGQVKQLTTGMHDYGTPAYCNGKLYVKRHSISAPDDIFQVDLNKKNTTTQLTHENAQFMDHLTMGEVKERWVKTTDGKEEQCWVIYPPHFDANKKYPTLLYCQGGPQSAVSQFWSYRWNLQIMAANGYIVIAPNRRGLPGYGKEWLEEISGDYTGQCMNDYLSAIDDICKEPYVDKDRLGCVGASFGGFSTYWLAGNHNKRFKCFIAHCGIFNSEQQFIETEEMWFSNWDQFEAPWYQKNANSIRNYAHSPHKFVDKWDAPILCIHGEKDYRISYSQGMSAFNAAVLRGIPAELLLYPDECHWVLKPQNGVLWQRTFFEWLDKWLKQPSAQANQ